jgi:WD40 repeat protein
LISVFIFQVILSREEVVYSSSRDKTIKLWKIGNGSHGAIATYEGHKLVVTGIDLNPGKHSMRKTCSSNHVQSILNSLSQDLFTFT